MNEYTSGPWKISLSDNATPYILTGGTYDDHTQEQMICVMPSEIISSFNSYANARRIVSCVNVLQGVPTEQLEEAARLGITDISSGNLFSSRLKLEQQRDKLLVAARKAVKDFRIESGPLVDAIAEIEAAK